MFPTDCGLRARHSRIVWRTELPSASKICEFIIVLLLLGKPARGRPPSAGPHVALDLSNVYLSASRSFIQQVESSQIQVIGPARERMRTHSGHRIGSRGRLVLTICNYADARPHCVSSPRDLSVLESRSSVCFNAAAAVIEVTDLTQSRRYRIYWAADMFIGTI